MLTSWEVMTFKAMLGRRVHGSGVRFRGRMTGFFARRLRHILSAFAIGFFAVSASANVTESSVAAAANAGEAPVELDAPDTDVSSAEAATAVAAADAQAAAFARATPELSRRIVAPAAGDTQFRSLFSAWRQLEGPAAQAISIPSRRPVDAMRLTSSFGHRSDPFTGRRARHNGIDIPGPVGTPIYATADGVIGRAQRLGGYGLYVEVNHGLSVQTRYGHLSQILVSPGQRVRRGELIGLMGSTGRSTGSHLHYEVRIAGAPVDPTPFVAEDGVMVAAATHADNAMGGPRE